MHISNSFGSHSYDDNIWYIVSFWNIRNQYRRTGLIRTSNFRISVSHRNYFSLLSSFFRLCLQIHRYIYIIYTHYGNLMQLHRVVRVWFGLLSQCDSLLMKKIKKNVFKRILSTPWAYVSHSISLPWKFARAWYSSSTCCCLLSFLFLFCTILPESQYLFLF